MMKFMFCQLIMEWSQPKASKALDVLISKYFNINLWSLHQAMSTYGPKLPSPYGSSLPWAHHQQV
jgi:hypothetical protein